MIVSIIVATDEQGVIGRDNSIPWHLPADLAYFKKITMDKPIIMGRRTFESIGRPLPGRLNIVISRDPKYSPAEVKIVHSLDEALAAAGHAKEVFIIGGEAIYRLALPKADRIYLTLVHTHAQGDKHFRFDGRDWRETSRRKYPADAQNRFAYDLIRLEAK